MVPAHVVPPPPLRRMWSQKERTLSWEVLGEHVLPQIYVIAVRRKLVERHAISRGDANLFPNTEGGVADGGDFPAREEAAESHVSPRFGTFPQTEPVDLYRGLFR